ncbi:MAG: hypothetical protein ACEPOW_04900 [Bacteroidales bacterium]
MKLVFELGKDKESCYYCCMKSGGNQIKVFFLLFSLCFLLMHDAIPHIHRITHFHHHSQLSLNNDLLIPISEKSSVDELHVEHAPFSSYILRGHVKSNIPHATMTVGIHYAYSMIGVLLSLFLIFDIFLQSKKKIFYNWVNDSLSCIYIQKPQLRGPPVI